MPVVRRAARQTAREAKAAAKAARVVHGEVIGALAARYFPPMERLCKVLGAPALESAQ
jgi:hypothetical protein